jgi:hypothetical protein
MSARPLTTLLLSTVICLLGGATASATTLLRLDGVGPLNLGMTRTAAVDTGWLAHRGRGCELGGPPIPITYRLAGRRAPSGLAGSVQFDRGHLSNVTVTAGARTAVGVLVGHTTAVGMGRLYRRAGFAAHVHADSVFQTTFVDVTRANGHFAIEGATTGRKVTVLGVPALELCE